MLETLHIEDLRSIASGDLRFAPGLTALVGPNGAGKTSVLEAIALLSGGRSFRTSKVRSIVRDGQAAARLSCTVEGPGGSTRLGATLAAPVDEHGVGTKRFTVDGAETPLLRFIGHLRTVVFTPDHLLLVTAEPKLRRSFLDGILSRRSASLLGALLQLNRVLLQRNRLLARVRDGLAAPDELDAWDGAFAAAALPIVAARLALVGELNALLPEIAARLSGGPRAFTIDYRPCVVEHTPEAWRALLKQARRRDVPLGRSTIGPQRESITLRVSGHELAQVGSRGEQRTAVLALKLAELELARADGGAHPLLLLDDVLSELDAAHCAALLAEARSTQTILTSATTPEVVRELGDDLTVLGLPEGLGARG